MPLLLLSGVKTWIGLVIFGVGCVVDLIQNGPTLQNAGGIVAGVGGLHKLVKRQ